MTPLDVALRKHRLNRAKLAKMAGVAPSTVQKWNDALRRDDITPSSWRSCAKALRCAGIDPAEVRPGAEEHTQAPAASLIPRIFAASPEALWLILDVLALDDHDDRETIRSVVKGRLTLDAAKVSK